MQSISVGGDIAKIYPESDYPTVYDDVADKAKKEQDNDERPAFTLDVNPEDYDTVFIGYPIWWYELPMIMDTFFDTYDFAGKTIVPFNTHAGSRDGGTYSDIRELEPDAEVPDGYYPTGNMDEKTMDQSIAEWLDGLGY